MDGERTRVAVLGATGSAGIDLVGLLIGHPWAARGAVLLCGHPEDAGLRLPGLSP